MADITDVNTQLDEMVQALQAELQTRKITDPLMIGIHTGGVWVAKALHQKLGLKDDLGTLNISFYRDDFTRIGIHPQVTPSSLPFEVDDRHIILVDDVLHTGRTIRAALNEIYDYGRPASVILAALVVRSGKELPICADVIGSQLELADGQQIKLNGPDAMSLEIQESK